MMTASQYDTRKADINRNAEAALDALGKNAKREKMDAATLIDRAYRIGRGQERDIAELNRQAFGGPSPTAELATEQPLTDEEHIARLEADVREAQLILDHVQEQADESDARALATPAGYDNERVRAASSRDSHRAVSAEERLVEARATLERVRRDIDLGGGS